MARRLNKRQQREIEELEALGGPSTQEENEESDEEEVMQKPKAGKTGFAALLGASVEVGSQSEAEEHVIKAKKPKKKKKKGPPSDNTKSLLPTSSRPSQTPTPTVKSEKKALKKAKAKERKAAEDELDEALRELSIKYPASQRMTQKTASGQTFADLLSISVQYLDPDAEMKRFFGAKVVQANKTAGPSSGSPARRQAAAARSILTRPQATWWAAKQREGLSIRNLTEDEVQAKLKLHGWDPVHDEKWWTVEYSKRYKSLTKVFMRTVASGDPQGFWDLLSKSPWHADTLLQLSEVYRHREEHASAVDFVDRAMFTYERAFVGAFNFTVGMNRLDFDRVENRPFFLAIHRQVADLQRRGCVRTAFEFAKLLYSLDPWADPHGALLHLDYLAVKAGMYQWVVDLHDMFSAGRQDARIDPSLLPGLTYAKALALRMMESGSHSTSTGALKDALQDFPSVLPLLADKLEISLPVAIRSHPDFRIETDANSLSPSVGAIHALSHLYVKRSHALWKDHADWLSTTAVETFANLPSRLPITSRRQRFLKLYDNQGPCYSAYRHLIVLETDHKNLFPFIPRHVQQNLRSLSCDPLPPPSAATGYDDTFFDGVDDLLSFRIRSSRERAMDGRRLAQMIPDGAFRQQLEAWFDGNPQFQDRFPGGILQFAQAIAQLPPDVLEDMMLADAMGGAPGPMEGAEGAMPGGLDLDILDMDEGAQPVFLQPAPGGQFGDRQMEEGVDHGSDEDYEDDEEDDEEEGDISPMPRAIRNILGRIWGRSAPVEEDSSSEEELLDNNGVD